MIKDREKGTGKNKQNNNKNNLFHFKAKNQDDQFVFGFNTKSIYLAGGRGGAPKSLQMVIAAMKLKDTYSLEGKLWPT